MAAKGWRVAVTACLAGLVVLCGARAQGIKPTDGGKAAAFKGKAFDLKDKGSAAITLTFEAGKKATVTVKSDEKTDVNLFVYDAAKKVVAKDESPGPDCEVNFTPKASGKYTLVVRNLGPGENHSTLKVSLGKTGPKEESKKE
jgi:hypothetical protein